MADVRLCEGSVVDAEGAPVAEALVSVEWGTAPTPEIALLTGNDGSFRIALPVGGTYVLRGISPGGNTGRTRIELSVSGPESVVIRLEPKDDS